MELDTDSICLFGPLVPLSGGSPSGGIWSGEGVVVDNWSPFESGPGVFPVGYTVAGENGCSATVTDTMKVELCFAMTAPSLDTAAPELNVYPVPADGWLMVGVEGGGQGLAGLAVFDTQGRAVNTAPLNGEAYHQLSLEGLAAGRYILRVQFTSGTVRTVPLTVVH